MLLSRRLALEGGVRAWACSAIGDVVSVRGAFGRLPVACLFVRCGQKLHRECVCAALLIEIENLGSQKARGGGGVRANMKMRLSLVLSCMLLDSVLSSDASPVARRERPSWQAKLQTYSIASIVRKRRFV